jgi:hypothetical protein
MIGNRTYHRRSLPTACSGFPAWSYAGCGSSSGPPNPDPRLAGDERIPAPSEVEDTFGAECRKVGRPRLRPIFGFANRFRHFGTLATTPSRGKDVDPIDAGVGVAGALRPPPRHRSARTERGGYADHARGQRLHVLHTHPDGKRLASAPRVIGMHIAMRFNVEQYQCEALFVAPSGEGNPAYDTAFPGTGGEPAVSEAPAEVSWDETLYKFEETLAGWLGLADEDPSRRTAEARYLAPDIIPDEYPELPHGVRFENEDSDGESSSSSTVSSSRADTVRNATDASSSVNARRAMTDELERLRARLAFLEAKAEGKEDAFRSQFGKTAGMGTEIGSAARTMRANVSAAQPRQTRPRLIVPRPMCAR